MSDSPQQPEVFKQSTDALSELEKQQPGSLLRLRDVQALNRSFRRLSDVQDALLRQMEEQEQHRQRQNRWLTPLSAFSSVAAALACGILAWSLWFGPKVEVQAPQVTVQAPAITVQAPDNAVDQKTLDALLVELKGMRSESREDRSMIASLNERLLEAERRELERLQQLGRTQPGTAEVNFLGGVATPADTTEASDSDSSDTSLVSGILSGEVLDPWLGATNGLLAVSGFDHLRFESGTRVEGDTTLRDVTLLEWNREGVIETVTKARSAAFELHQMAGTLVVVLLDGHRIHDGSRTILPGEGLRLEFAGIDTSLWLAHFPELAASTGSDPGFAAKVREQLDELLSTPSPGGYFRIPVMESVTGTTLRLVQVNRYDNGGRLVRTLAADSLEVRLHPGGDVELLFRDGAILEGGLERPFYEDRFRVYLPRQDLDKWRRGDIPLVELG